MSSIVAMANFKLVFFCEVVSLKSNNKKTEQIVGMTKKHPVVDIGRCTLCGGCIEVAPDVFRFSESFGYVEVVESEEYLQEDIDEAIKICPTDCIEWEE